MFSSSLQERLWWLHSIYVLAGKKLQAREKYLENQSLLVKNKIKVSFGNSLSSSLFGLCSLCKNNDALFLEF